MKNTEKPIMKMSARNFAILLPTPPSGLSFQIAPSTPTSPAATSTSSPALQLVARTSVKAPTTSEAIPAM